MHIIKNIELVVIAYTASKLTKLKLKKIRLLHLVADKHALH